jgi:hypothetical protein
MTAYAEHPRIVQSAAKLTMTTSFKSLTNIKKHDPVIFFFSKYSFRPTSTKSLKRTVIYSNISLSGLFVC